MFGRRQTGSQTGSFTFAGCRRRHSFDQLSPTATHIAALHEVLNASSDAVLAIDAEGMTQFANRRAEAVFGHSREAMQLMPAHELVHNLGARLHAVAAQQRQSVHHGSTAGPGVEVQGRRADGQTFPARLWLTWPSWPQDTFLVYATIADLSSQRFARSAQAQLRGEVLTLRESVGALIESQRDRAVLLLDAEGRIVRTNRSSEKLLGAAATDLVGEMFSQLSDPAQLQAVRDELGVDPDLDPLLEITRSGLVNRQTWKLRHRDGQLRAVTLTIAAIGDLDDLRGFLVTARVRRDQGEALMPPIAPPSAETTPADAEPPTDRLLANLDDAATRILTWQVGGTSGKRR